MSRLFDQSHRALQDDFGTRALADRIEALACRTEFDPDSQGFIESMDMFFLATVDERGRPTVSYKGGAPGFVRILDPQTLVFPSYDGNGMFLSLGNIDARHEVGMLFISFLSPHRIRVQGHASIERDADLLAGFPGAELLVRVQLSELWQNCPRYIHRYEQVGRSRYVPKAECETPLAQWKRIDLVQDVIVPADAERAQAAGTISIESWIEQVKSGDPEA
jgi:uncharacterized protein